MIGVPFVVLGLLLIAAAVAGDRASGRARGAFGTFVLSPLQPATWRATGAILLGSWIELLAFGLVLSAFSSGTSLLFIGVGVVVIGLGVEISRLTARVERWRAALADSRPLRPHPYRPLRRNPRDLLLAVFADVSRWRDVVYVFVAFPLAILEALVVGVLWAASLSLLSVPAWYLVSVPGPTLGDAAVPPALVATIAGLLGLVLAPIAASVSQGLMALHRAVVAGLLCESERRALERRVETLETSRRAVLDVEAGELRRIERDLHDGAQQRLVGLTIDLSLAAEKIESDPSGARELVVGARDQARLALAELRDLVRGIAPAILLDRGLVPALSSLAARGAVPTTVTSTLPEGIRLPDAMERAGYFVVAEALANVAKHAAAEHCEVRCRAEERGLVVEVWDDGAGGARVVPGGGLAGLAGRVEALDGSLVVESPVGGPTTVRALIPATAAGGAAAAPIPPATEPPAAGPPSAPAPGPSTG